MVNNSVSIGNYGRCEVMGGAINHEERVYKLQVSMTLLKYPFTSF
ncbi:hypothetical protein SLEP1_g31450 [Rubroshorea leprosula]|uniref:Uncharacterized protein n=1 Tax=Rubroshorea leprosula TaxID=152421 RepID=A0AAV5K3E4_9ROSI|nr:hypothetical protein SLEP1_g31450 [Rubroshorea leprosula]